MSQKPTSSLNVTPTTDTGLCIMPVRTPEEVSSGSGSQGNEEVGWKSTPARDVVNCTCGKKRESAAKDKRDWVQCDLSRC